MDSLVYILPISIDTPKIVALKIGKSFLNSLQELETHISHMVQDSSLIAGNRSKYNGLE